MANQSRDHGFAEDKTTETPATVKGKAYIFAIGIDRYQYCKPLEFAVSDVKALLEILRSRYQFKDKVFVLLDEQATRKNIHARFRQLAQTVSPDDTLLIYYAGHGWYDRDGLKEGYWIPVEGRPDDPASLFSGVEIRSAIGKINSLHTLIISDSCFSGTLFRSSAFIPREEMLSRTRSRRMLTSGRDEVVPDKSKLSESLLRFLTNNETAAVRMSEVYDSIKISIHNNSWQTPRYDPLYEAGDDGGELIFRLDGRQVVPFGNEVIPDKSPIGPSKPVLKRKTCLINISITFAMCLMGWFVKEMFLNKPVAPERDFTIIEPAGEQLIVIRDKTNNLYGYARVADTSIAIASKFDEAGPFKNGLALVKLKGKYGFMRMDSGYTIDPVYDFVTVLENRQIRAVLGQDTFWFDLSGRIVETAGTIKSNKPDSPHQKPPVPTTTQITTDSKTIYFGEITLGGSKSIPLSVKNLGKISTKGFRIAKSCAAISIQAVPGNIPAGDEAIFSARWMATGDTGYQQCVLTLSAENVPKKIEITLTAHIIEPITAPQPMCLVHFDTRGIGGVKIWFEDIGEQEAKISSPDSLTVSFRIPRSMIRKNVDINFSNKRGKTVRRTIFISDCPYKSEIPRDIF